jgi:aryl sulfotransferase
MTRGTFEWEREGYPWWGNLHHVQSWWDWRHLDNVLFVHFSDLLGDLEHQVRRIAAFLDIEIHEAGLPAMLEALSLTSMRAEAIQRHGDPERAARFFFKGTNGRWRDELTPEEVALYEETASAVLAPECRAWLEHGGPALR